MFSALYSQQQCRNVHQPAVVAPTMMNSKYWNKIEERATQYIRSVQTEWSFKLINEAMQKILLKKEFCYAVCFEYWFGRIQFF